MEPCRTDSVDACEYGTLTDERDGQTYKTVTIGSQTWMAENLNYQTANSYCYDNIVYNSTTYGRLYTWAAAMDSVGIWSKNGKGCGYGKTYGKTCSPTYPVRGVCPEGWHLPTIAEFETLFTAVGGYSTADEMLKSTSGWNGSGNGTDSYAFSAKPAGYRDSSGSYYHWGYDAYFWSSAEKNGNYAYYMRLDYYDDYAYYMGMFYDDGAAYLIGRNKDRGFSVRCLKD
ncbi:MAG: fibrobacter succinogenes major paralogous domain-containing protein [Fibrobacter sp.]|nr:fibrobacter succinogenes major paralogous domain-containing protein [Fibrobacter sp.]